MMMELLNRLVLRGNQLGIFHCGVQVHGDEWSFMFLANEGTEFDNPLGTGVLQYAPREFPRYKFCESIKVGYTELSARSTLEIVWGLSAEWSAHSYHVTRRNCLQFAETFVEKLGLRHCFPGWLKNAYETVIKSPGMSSVVDSTWACTKWYMMTRYGQDQHRSCKCFTNGLGCRACTSAQSCAICEKSEQVVVPGSSDEIVSEETFQEPNVAFNVSTCAEGAYCTVYSFTQVDDNIFEICFEAVETNTNESPQDPMNSKISWKGGCLWPISKSILRDDRREGCNTLVGALFYQGVPETVMRGETELVFQYGSREYSSVPLRTRARGPVGVRAPVNHINELMQRENFIILV